MRLHISRPPALQRRPAVRRRPARPAPLEGLRGVAAGPAVAGTQDYFGIEFYLDLAVGAAQAAFAQRHGLTLLPDVASREELGLFPLDGVIVNDPVTSDQRLLSLDALEIPYVTIERALDRPEHSRWVAGDTIAGTRKALDHLGATGAERIALLTLRHAWAWLAETEQSYRDWCTERGREPIVIDITGRLRADTRLSIDDSLARGLADVDGLFTASDRCAVAAVSALHAEGRQVGRDVVLACGVDTALPRSTGPRSRRWSSSRERSRRPR
jgi:DNA-binding LacI/PurR family transcriptional regulator